MNSCKLVIKDQVNCKIENLEPEIRRAIVETCSYFVNYARFLPSYKLGRWNGKKSFATIGGGTYLNLLDRVLPIVIDAGYDIEVEDRRPSYNFSFPEIDENFLSHKTWPEGHVREGEPIVLRDYQVAAINTFTANIQSIQALPTGSGKTVLSAALSYICEPYGKTLIIVPNRDLVEQTEADYINLGLDVGVLFGGRHEYGHQHTIATWQTLMGEKKKGKKQENIDFDQLCDGLVCVMVDEAHTISGDELRSLLCTPFANVPIRWAFTGTIPKDEFAFTNLLISIGQVVGELKTKELQDKGVLAECDIEIIQMDDSHVEFKDYHDEHKYLTSDRTRIKWIAEYIENLSLSGNVLVLIDRIDTGDQLNEYIPESVFVNGSTKSKDRRKEYKSVEEGGEKVIIATAGVAAVGISITYIDHVVFISYGKSFTKSIQTIGRGLRKGGDKTHVKIHDICSNLKFDKTHLTTRKSYYREQQFPFTIKKVKYR